MIRTRHVAQVAFCDETACDNGGCANQLLMGMAAEIKWIDFGIDVNAVQVDFLADVAGDHVGVIAILLQVVILPLGRFIRQVQGFGDVALNDFIIRIE